jgi:uncharacterized membrane protein YedE/YeeE
VGAPVNELLGPLALGLAFGFVLQRGGFCGAALLSSAVLYRSYQGLLAILVAVLVSMVGFAALGQLEWIIPNPNPLRLLSAVVGGLLFGVGMVLAGGCVTGTLYKAGEGRLTSMLAVVGIGLGALLIDGGALEPLKRTLVQATRGVEGYAGLEEAVGLPYPLASAIVGAVGLLALAIVFAIRRGSPLPTLKPSMAKLVRGGWSPITAGALVGVLGWLAYLSSSAAGRNYPLGAHGGVKSAFSMLTRGELGGSRWMLVVVGGIVAGSAASAAMRRDLKLRSGDAPTLLFALLGGVLLGAGATIGRGCFIGNSVSGLALLSLHSVVFTVCVVAANWTTTLLYLRGLK